MIRISFKHKNLILSRKNGPVCFDSDGRLEYFLNHQRHRVDGPAFVSRKIKFSAYYGYFLNGIQYSKKVYYNLINK